MTPAPPIPAPDFRSLFESAPGLYLALAPDLTIVAVSDAYLRATMTVRDDILGRGLFAVFPDNPADPAATGVSNLSASLARVLEQRVTDTMAVQKYDIRRPEAEGGGFEERYWSPINTPVLGADGAVAYVIHRVEDVTEFVRLKEQRERQHDLTEQLRSRTERMDSEIFQRARELQELNQTLREANQKLAEHARERAQLYERLSLLERKETQSLRTRQRQLLAAIDGLSDAVFVKDVRGRYLVANPALAAFTGRKGDDVIGKTAEELVAAPLARTAADTEQLVLADGKTRSYEVTLGSDAEARTLLVTKGPYRNEVGEIVGTTGLAHDITERKRAELALEETNAALRRSNDDLSRFAYAASHDLQEPLRMVTIFAQLLESRLDGRLDAESAEFLRVVVESALRMSSLLQDLLAYSRVNAELDSPVKPVACADALRSALLNLESAIRESGATVTHSTLPTLKVHESHLVQLFQNLIGNAIKYHGPQRPLVKLEAEASGGEWIVSVKDNGIGVDPRYAEQIFVLFKRLHGRTHPGAGIGLALCKRVVERYGGRIWVESEPGRGARFRFSVPAALAVNPGS